MGRPLLPALRAFPGAGDSRSPYQPRPTADPRTLGAARTARHLVVRETELPPGGAMRLLAPFTSAADRTLSRAPRGAAATPSKGSDDEE